MCWRALYAPGATESCGRQLKGEEGPGIADDDPAVADRYKRCASAIPERRSEDRSNSAVSKKFQANRLCPEFRGLRTSPACAPCSRRAARDSHRALSRGGLCSSRPDPDRIFVGPNKDRLDSEPPSLQSTPLSTPPMLRAGQHQR